VSFVRFRAPPSGEIHKDIPEQEPNCALPLYSGTKPRPILLFSSEIANPPQFQDLKPVSLKVNCTFGLANKLKFFV
jgi:hypothetical protein